MVSLKSTKRLGFYFLLPFFITNCLINNYIMATSCTSAQQCEAIAVCQSLAQEVKATYGGDLMFMCHINQCQAGSTKGEFFNC